MLYVASHLRENPSQAVLQTLRLSGLTRVPTFRFAGTVWDYYFHLQLRAVPFGASSSYRYLSEP